ncbi:MAG: Arc family DNA-binding protein [Bacteroidales bacterium]|nr:Arc family DNA-binding protein [Bacteroidales bacterium]
MIRQTIVRMDESLYQKVKSAAKTQHRSVNSFINNVLDEAVASAIPKLKPEEYKPSAELLEFGLLLDGATEEMDNLDPKAQYILSK